MKTYRERRCIRVLTGLDEAWHPVERIGGHTGWYYADSLWRLRGMVDAMTGGPGMRGRPSPDTLAPGDPVDMWRVETVVPPTHLTLVAEANLPGTARLHFQLEPDERATRITMDLEFETNNMTGSIYWFSVLPFHILIFRGMLSGIGKATGQPFDWVDA